MPRLIAVAFGSDSEIGETFSVMERHLQFNLDKYILSYPKIEIGNGECAAVMCLPLVSDELDEGELKFLETMETNYKFMWRFVI